MFLFKKCTLPHIKTLYLILSLLACLCLPSDGFTLERNTPTRSTQLFVGNFISGLTNSPPSKPLLNKELEGQLVSGTSLQSKELKCVYKASEDGWSAIDFHRCVDDKGSSLMVALTRTGQVFGGFNPLGWRSTDDYYDSNSAFLWFAKGSKAVKSPILPGGNAAVFDYATGGPCFGAADLVIGEPKAAVMGGFAGPDVMDTSFNAGNLKEGRCSVGGSYQLVGKTGFPVRGNFQLVQLEVYCNAAIADSPTGSGAPGWWPF